MNTVNPTRKLSPIEVGFNDDPQLPVLAFGLEVTNATCADYHTHPRGQLVYASKGVVFVYTTENVWVVPSSQCLWIPSYTNHQVEFKGSVSLKNVFIHPLSATDLPQTCVLWLVSPLLKELLERAVLHTDYQPNTPVSRMMDVVLDELLLLEKSPLSLPLPQDVRLKKVVSALISTPPQRHPMEYWADLACMSPRHLSRLFQQQTGRTFQNWHIRWVLLQSIDLLTKGKPVATVSIELGYQTPSSFIEAFKKIFGKTPGSYISD